MKERIWPIAFCVCLLVAASPIHLSQERESKWPCKDDPNLLRDKNGKPVWLGPELMRDRAIHKVDPYRDPHLNASSTAFVDLLVNEEGKVVCATVPSGHPIWRNHAISAAIKWRFQPMIDGGRKVSYLGRLLFALTKD